MLYKYDSFKKNNFKTTLSVPERPSLIKALFAGANSVMVSWRPPGRSQGKITHYTVHWANPGGRSHSRTRIIDPHSTHALITDLTISTYQVCITPNFIIDDQFLYL